MADHTKPDGGSTYNTDWYTQLNARFSDHAKLFDTAKTTATNIVTDTVAVSSTNKRFELWNGSAWVKLFDKYMIDVEGAITSTSLTSSDGIIFTGTGKRITGDFTNATIANRVMFQTSTVNGRSNLSVLPNGTSTAAGLDLYASSADPSNASLLRVSNTGAEFQIEGTRTGTGTYLPLTVYAGGAEGLRLDTSRNFGVGVTPAARFHVASPFVTSGRFDSAISASPASDDAGEVFSWRGNAAVSGVTFSGSDARLLTVGVDTNNAAYIRASSLNLKGAIVSLTTAGLTRFQAGTAGQWGIAGANYGTTGQTIFSGGASAAPSWSSLAGVGGAFTAYRSTSQTSGTTVIFDSATVSIGPCYNTSTGVFTAQATGWYQLNMSVQIENVSGAAVGRVISLVANGVTVATAQQSTSEIPNNTTKSFNASASVYLTSGQTAYVSASAVFSSNVRALGSTGCSFSGCYLGA